MGAAHNNHQSFADVARSVVSLSVCGLCVWSVCVCACVRACVCVVLETCVSSTETAEAIQTSSHVTDSLPHVSQGPAKTGHHECSSSKLCVAAPVVASSSLEEVLRWLG